MSDSTTTARPYAKAIFEQALVENKLADWSEHLLELAQAVLVPQASAFIANPASTAEQHVELLQAVAKGRMAEDKTINKLLHLLATNKRLMLLPAIQLLYEAHRAEQEKTLDVDVICFSTISAAQQQKLIDSLSKRLQRKVALKISIDATLLGGALIQAGDLVIDGSVRGKLNKLSTDLAA
ncbi:MAG: F0F1 ATP synthase subunit delta [Legionellales bacterium]